MAVKKTNNKIKKRAKIVSAKVKPKSKKTISGNVKIFAKKKSAINKKAVPAAARNIARAMVSISDLITPVHLKTDNQAAIRIAIPPQGQAFPLFDVNMPFNTSNVTATKITNIEKVISYLKVSDPLHKRYKPNGNTFCNIYAYDVAYLMGSKIGSYYLPRVWWKKAAIDKIKSGVAQTPAYGVTVDEMSANTLYQWFNDYGPGFGWFETSNLHELQEYSNSTGEIGVIVGKKNPHGHITIVVPEQCGQTVNPVITAKRNGAGLVTIPLQSQAGSVNFEYGAKTNWFNNGSHVSAYFIFKKL